MNQIQTARHFQAATLPQDGQDANAIRRYLLIERTELAPADAILIFGNRHIVQRSAWQAYRLYNQGLAPLIVASGGVRLADGRTEARALSEELLRYGLPKKALLIEDKSTNTRENVVFSRELSARDWNSVIGVGHIIGSRRFAMTLTANCPGILPMMANVNPYPVDADQWHLHPGFARHAGRELAKIPVYLERGHIAEIDLEDINRRAVAARKSFPERTFTP